MPVNSPTNFPSQAQKIVLNVLLEFNSKNTNVTCSYGKRAFLFISFDSSIAW